MLLVSIYQNNLSKLIPENLFQSFKQTILEAYDDNEDGLYEIKYATKYIV
jgi:hypothetical protein